eukprot:g3035.t1
MEANQKAYVVKVQQAISGFLSTQQQVRDQASRGLLMILRQDQTSQHRALAAVFLRKKLPTGKPVYIDSLSVQLQGQVKSGLLQALAQDPDRYVRNQISDTVAALAELLLPRKEAWRELLPCLEKLAGHASATEEQRITGLGLWGNLFKYCPDSLQACLAPARAIYGHNMSHPSLAVRFEALNACCKTIMTLTQPTQVPLFKDFAPLMLTTLGALLKTKQVNLANRLISAMIDVADTWATFYRSSLTTFGSAMLQIVQNRTFPDSTRQLAMEWSCAVCEREPAMARKRHEFVLACINAAFSLMLCVEEDSGWDQREEEGGGDEDDDSCFSVGSEAIDRLAQSLRAKKILPFTFKLIKELMDKEDWKLRHAGLSALAQVAEVADLSQIPVLRVIHFTHDPHSRVRWAAMNCLGQLATDFAPTLQCQYHTAIFPALMEVLEEKDKPRLQKHALCTLCNVLTVESETDVAESEFVEPYAALLMQILFQLLQNGQRIVQEEVVTAIAAVAGVATDAFKPWYPRVVPLMKNIIVLANERSLSMLRSRAMEAVTFIGMACGQEMFRKDAEGIVSIFLQIMKQGAAPDDTSQQYMLKAWTRIAAVLGRDFAAYLPHVLPFVFAEARRPVELGSPDENSHTDTAIEMRQQERVWSSAVEDKVVACSMLCSFLLDLQDAYFPYLQETADIMLPLLGFYAGPAVRRCAISIMPDLLSVAQSSLSQNKCTIAYVVTLCRRVTDAMVECFKSEDEIEVLSLLVQHMGKIFNQISPDIAQRCLDRDALQHVGNALFTLLTTSHERIRRREQLRQGEDFDEDAEATLQLDNAAEDTLNFIVTECMGALVKTHREHFLPTFDLLLPEILRMLAPASFWGTRKIALYMIVDVIEHIGPGAAKYLPTFVPIMLRGLRDENPETRQPCAYGLGIAAKQMGSSFKPFAPAMEQALLVELKRPGAHEGMIQHVTDNVVSAIGKLAVHQNHPHLLVVWLSGLPITGDEEEAPWCTETLCALLEQKNPALLGPNNSNLPKIVCVLGTVLANDRLRQMVPQTLPNRMVKLLKAIKSSLSEQQLQSLVSSLPQKDQTVIANVLRSL